MVSLKFSVQCSEQRQLHLAMFVTRQLLSDFFRKILFCAKKWTKLQELDQGRGCVVEEGGGVVV